MYRMAYSLAVFFMMLLALPAIAQKNVEKQDLLWTRYALKVRLNDSWMIQAGTGKQDLLVPLAATPVCDTYPGRQETGKGLERRGWIRLF